MSIEHYDVLPNKPLVEAILEIKWGEPTQPDTAHPIIVGRLYERLSQQYPVIEDLPVTQVPPDLTVHVVRHRFRASDKGWPLVQIGPGIMTLNDTEGYIWPDFRRRALELPLMLQQSHPNPEMLGVTSLMLQYIDAVEFDYIHEDVRKFLNGFLHVDIGIPASLFDGQPVENKPTELVLQSTFPSSDPKASVQLRISTGRRNNQPAVVWHTLIKTVGMDAQEAWQDFGKWIDSAHDVVHHWFFALVQGELLEAFKNHEHVTDRRS